MANLQDFLFFPVHDAEARKQFLFTCLISLASFFIPILPLFLIMGYSVKVMRQIVDERQAPTMPDWQKVDWAETFMDGVKLYGLQLVLMFPLLVLMGCGMISLFGGMTSMSLLAEESTRSLAPVGGVFLFVGFAVMMLFSLLSLPYQVVISAAAPHMVAKGSFAAGFEFKEWFAIFRKGLGQFLLAFALTFVTSFVFAIVMQVALITIVLMCIVPFLMIPYSAYLMLITNTLNARAYLAGRDALQADEHAPA